MEKSSNITTRPTSPISKTNQGNSVEFTTLNKLSINSANLEKSRNYVIKNNYWNERHERILEGLQKNTNKFYREYQKAHLVYKKKLRLYRIPIIILSSLGGFLSISNSGYIPPEYNKWVSLLVGFVNLVMTMVSLIENFKKIDVNVNKTYTAYLEFKKLHDEISLTLNTPREERDNNGYDMVLVFFNRYEAYLGDAPILAKVVHDYLDDNSPDNSTQTLMASGSEDLSETTKNIRSSNKRKTSYTDFEEDLTDYSSVLSHYEDLDDIEAPYYRADKIRKLFSQEPAEKIVSLSNKLAEENNENNENKKRVTNNINMVDDMENSKEKINQKSKKLSVSDRLQKVNKFQEQINKMNEEIRPDDKIIKFNNIENKLIKGPEILNIKISNELEKHKEKLDEDGRFIINLVSDEENIDNKSSE